MAPVDRQKRPGPEKLEAALQGDEGRLRDLVAEAHPADLATWMQDLDPEDVWRIWGLLGADERAELLMGASDALREDLVNRLMPGELVEVVEKLPTDDVVDLLAIPDEQTTEQVLRAVDYERAEGLRELLHYPEDSAGGLMNTDYVSVHTGTRIGDAIKEIKSEEQPVDQVEGLFVLDPRGRPLGYVSDRDLLTTGIHTPVDEAMEEVVTVSAHEDQEEVAHLIQKYDLSALPVVDGAGVLIGAVTADDVRDVLEEEAEEDIRRLVGTSTEQQTRLPVLARVRHRMPLQALTVIGGLGTAHILAWALPETGGPAGSNTDLLRYIPIIVGLAGNVGIQSSTILVRAFATGEVQPDRELSVLWSETRVGMLIGLLCGLATAVVASLLEGGSPAAWNFGAALGAAIWVAVTWASFLGCTVPMVCKRFGIDPAVVAGPFLITLSDVSGASIFVGVAHLLIGLAAGPGA